jgi:multidrug resistance efflux pump
MKPVPTVIRFIVTLILVGCAILAAQWMWNHYEVEPWTRDGRVRADVVEVAPDVSGLITQVDVADNAPVHKGERLFVLDQPRYTVAVEQASAVVQAQTTALAQARREDVRNRKLGDLVPAETVEEGASKVAQLTAAVAQAQAGLDAAKLNLARTTVYAPVDGTVANVDLHPGDYLAAGHAALGLVDVASLHVDGYFEETKLARIHVGDRAEVQLVGDKRLLKGHVVSISPGIDDRERGPSGDLLPNVNPTFSWVRLAQRIPVRIRLDESPADITLISGRTATVIVHPTSVAKGQAPKGGKS